MDTTAFINLENEERLSVTIKDDNDETHRVYLYDKDSNCKIYYVIKDKDKLIIDDKNRGIIKEFYKINGERSRKLDSYIKQILLSKYTKCNF